jgi:hypothetical protein
MQEALDLVCPRCQAIYLTEKNFYKGSKICKYCKTIQSNKINPKKEMKISSKEYHYLLTLECAYCKEPANGVDRWFSDQPYTKKNCLPACTRCNCDLKNDLSPPEWLAKLCMMYGPDYTFKYKYDWKSYELLDPPLIKLRPPAPPKLQPKKEPTCWNDVNALFN